MLLLVLSNLVAFEKNSRRSEYDVQLSEVVPLNTGI